MAVKAQVAPELPSCPEARAAIASPTAWSLANAVVGQRGATGVVAVAVSHARPYVAHMRIDSAVTSVSWIPSEAVAGMTKMTFAGGVAH